MENKSWFNDMIEESRGTLEFRLEALEIKVTERILEIMEEKNVSRSELAEKLSVSRAAITKLFRDGSNMTLKRLLGIACALDSEIDIVIEPLKKEAGSDDKKLQFSNVYDFGRLKQIRAEGQIRSVNVRTEISFKELNEEYLNVCNGY